MRSDRHRQEEEKRFLGTYKLPWGQEAVGELTLKGADTLLRLHSNEFLRPVEPGSSVTGVAHNGDCISLIDCHGPGSGSLSRVGSPTRYQSEVFPHHVAIGQRHLNPADACIASIQFTTTDLATLFYDYDAFSHVIDARPIIDVVLREQREVRPVDTGAWPQVFYYTGKDLIVEIPTGLGKVSVNHRPRFNTGGPQGAYIKNRIVISIEPDAPTTFEAAIDRMDQVRCFLSMAAGRAQGLSRIELVTTETIDEHPVRLRIHPSFRWKTSGGKSFDPHPGDTPLDPIRRRSEFETVFVNWLERHKEWRIARNQHLSCVRRANKYGSARLVAAANMFDILPVNAFPVATPLDEELKRARDACSQILRKLPQGPDRNSALSALGRLGLPSLPKKVAHRVSLVESKLGASFPDLKFVANTAVKCRNFYVHGSSGDVDFTAIEPLIPFLTDSLEFTFAASDFIEAGWDTTQWSGRHFGWGHSFARFRWGYSEALARLQHATSST